MNFIKVLGELQKWLPALEMLKGMFGDPDKAMAEIRAWELGKRAENDKRLAALRERDDS
jgi:hypothetical protein